MLYTFENPKDILYTNSYIGRGLMIDNEPENTNYSEWVDENIWVDEKSWTEYE